MAVRLRLTRVGKKKQPTYRIVAADRRSPRDGRFIEIIGTYNPRAEPSAIKVDNTAALKWLKNGAQPSERVKKLLELSGAWAAHTTGADAPEMFEVPEPTAAPEPTSEPVSAVADGSDASDLTRASEVAEYLAKSLADEPDAVSVAVNTDGDTPQIDVTVAQGDLGRVIGKRGRVANAFRTVVRAAAHLDDSQVDVEFDSLTDAAAPAPSGDRLEVGRLLKPHGLAGEMVVQLLSDRTERVAKGSVLYHEGGALTVRSSRPHQDRYLVRFDEVSSREQCDALRGRTLTAPPLDDADGYWVHELVGATVVTADGVERGVVESVQANPANDLLVLDGGALVPVTFIVDGPADGRVTVEVPDGLFELYA